MYTTLHFVFMSINISLDRIFKGLHTCKSCCCERTFKLFLTFLQDNKIYIFIY